MKFFQILIQFSIGLLLIIEFSDGLKLKECPILTSDMCTKHCDAINNCPKGWHRSFEELKYPVCYCQRAFNQEEKNMISKDDCTQFFYQCFHLSSTEYSCNRISEVCKQEDIEKRCNEAFIELYVIKGRDISAKIENVCQDPLKNKNNSSNLFQAEILQDWMQGYKKMKDAKKLKKTKN